MENEHLTLRTFGNSIVSPDTLIRHDPCSALAHGLGLLLALVPTPRGHHAWKEVLESPFMSEQ